MIAGIMLAGGGMAVTGFISSFAGLCAAVIISGIGVAMFHPQGAQMVNKTSDDSAKATNLGIFSFGGNLGFTLGPVFASCAIAVMGLKGTIVIFVPSIIFGAVTAVTFKDSHAYSSPSSYQASAGSPEKGPSSAVSHDADSSSTGTLTPQPMLKDMWGAFARLCMLISFRSIIFSGVNTFLVMYFVDILGKSENLGNAMLSFYYAVAAFSSLLGGFMADKAGTRLTAVISMAILVPSLLILAALLSKPDTD